MIELSLAQYPQKELIAKCGECGGEVWRRAWDTYNDYNRIRAAAKKKCKKCPHCGKTNEADTLTKVEWQKHKDIYGRTTQDWEALTESGDFLVWKHGKIWRGRWREYGSDNPIMLGFSSSLEGIKRRCERSQYWPNSQEGKNI